MKLDLTNAKDAVANLEFLGALNDDGYILDSVAVLKDFIRDVELSQKSVVKQFPTLLHKVGG